MSDPETKPNGVVDPEMHILHSYMEKVYQLNRHYDFEDTDSESDQPSSDKNKKCKTLCLQNVPRELTNNGIRNLCDRCGKAGDIPRPAESLAFVDLISER